MKKKVSLVVVQDPKGRILLLKRGPNDKWKPNQWALPGGHVNFFESHKKGAMRELFEETHIKAERMTLIEKKGKMMVWYVDSWRGKVDLQKASHGFEHSSYVWLYPEQIVSQPDVVSELRSWSPLMYLEKF